MAFLGKEGVSERAQLLGRPFDLDRREADPVSLVEDLVSRDRLPIDADQIVLGATVLNTLCEERGNRRPVRHVNVVGETAAIVVDVEDFHD